MDQKFTKPIHELVQMTRAKPSKHRRPAAALGSGFQSGAWPCFDSYTSGKAAWAEAFWLHNHPTRHRATRSESFGKSSMKCDEQYHQYPVPDLKHSNDELGLVGLSVLNRKIHGRCAPRNRWFLYYNSMHIFWVVGASKYAVT